MNDVYLKSLCDEDLDALSSDVYLERKRRIDVKLRDGSILPFNVEERNTATVSKFDAVKAYRNRTGASLTVANAAYNNRNG